MNKNKLRSIISVARMLGISRKYLELYGEYKAKVSLDILSKVKSAKKGKYIVVTGITPTHLGEGKTVTTIGLSMALNKGKVKAAACIREPSIGPFFGIKGGGVGGGGSQVLPADDINLHLTGDIHAVSSAHNLCAAFIDNHLFHGNSLGIDKTKIFWKRVVDMNDRALRSVRVGLGSGTNSVERDTGFDITAASELMAILALSESIPDMRKRVGRVVIGLTTSGRPVTCEDLRCAGAMSALLSNALKPNIVQTSEGTPCFIHTGPFANITHGNSSIVADRMALGLADYVVTESGFGADCGMEKFVDIKCRYSGLKPSCAVLVVTIRALKIHSGMYKMVVGRDLDKEIKQENVDAVGAGCSNLEKQIDNVRAFGIPCIVAINRFASDTERETAAVKARAFQAGAFACVASDLYRKGSAGGKELADAVVTACNVTNKFNFLYPLDLPIKTKIAAIATKIYGARGVQYSPAAEKDIAVFEKSGFGKLPVCMAKTHLSLSHDPKLKGAPHNFTIPIRDVRPSIGAGFVYALCGGTATMPALPSHPVGERIDIDPNGKMVLKQVISSKAAKAQLKRG